MLGGNFNGYAYILCKATFATMHVVLKQLKTCVILLGGFLVFQYDLGTKIFLGGNNGYKWNGLLHLPKSTKNT
jgi:hypothetical protein